MYEVCIGRISGTGGGQTSSWVETLFFQREKIPMVLHENKRTTLGPNAMDTVVENPAPPVGWRRSVPVGVCSAMHPTFPNSWAQGKLQSKPDGLLIVAPSAGWPDPFEQLRGSTVPTGLVGISQHAAPTRPCQGCQCYVDGATTSSEPNRTISMLWLGTKRLPPTWHGVSPSKRQRNTLSSCPGGNEGNSSTSPPS